VVCGVVLCAAACSVRRAPPPLVGGQQEGTASWYGPGFHGRQTANGEIYDQYEMTAAHPSLPLGSRAMVTNLSNGHAVEVRVNDRGPFVGGRVIDLSYAAAHAIGMVGPGTAPVRIEVLELAQPRRTARRTPRPVVPVAAQVPSELPRATFVVQVASFTDPGTAEHLRRSIALRFPDAYVDPLDTTDGRYHRVRIGPYPLRAVAVARAELVNRLGYPAIIMEEAPGP
jgi:rare lipoprotein A